VHGSNPVPVSLLPGQVVSHRLKSCLPYSHTLRVASVVILEQSVPYGMRRIKFWLKALACALDFALWPSPSPLASPPAHPLSVSCKSPSAPHRFLGKLFPPSALHRCHLRPPPPPFPWSRSLPLLFTPRPLSIPSLCATLSFAIPLPSSSDVARPFPCLFRNPILLRRFLAPKTAPVSPVALKPLVPHISQDLFVATESSCKVSGLESSHDVGPQKRVLGGYL